MPLTGDPSPVLVPPDPDNPLGQYAMRLGIWADLLHGTNKRHGVDAGVRALYPAASSGH